MGSARGRGGRRPRRVRRPPPTRGGGRTASAPTRSGPAPAAWPGRRGCAGREASSPRRTSKARWVPGRAREARVARRRSRALAHSHARPRTDELDDLVERRVDAEHAVDAALLEPGDVLRQDRPAAADQDLLASLLSEVLEQPRED